MKLDSAQMTPWGGKAIDEVWAGILAQNTPAEVFSRSPFKDFGLIGRMRVLFAAFPTISFMDCRMVSELNPQSDEVNALITPHWRVGCSASDQLRAALIERTDLVSALREIRGHMPIWSPERVFGVLRLGIPIDTDVANKVLKWKGFDFIGNMGDSELRMLLIPYIEQA
jgi:hypothetical protein